MINHHALTEEQKRNYGQFCDFVCQHVEPYDRDWDRRQGVPDEVIRLCGQAGFLGGIIPREFGGGGWDAVTFGLLNEAFGAASSALCGLYTVHTMVAMSLVKWGSADQQERWLPPMARGDIIAAFAMTEPGAGSDLQAMETTFTRRGNIYLLKGTKKWITHSAIADIFLVFGKLGDKPLAGILRSDAPGVKVEPLKDMLGFRAAHLSRIEFNDCELAQEDLVGKPGFALSYVAPYGLHYGRLSTAWSAAGLLRACVEAGATYACRRRAFDSLLMDHGMIRQMVTDMGVNLEAARELCLSAALAEDAHLPQSVEKTLIAKYFASRAAAQAAADAVQIMGAAGCHEENPAARYYRNAKIMQIIEGTDQVLQKILGRSFCQQFRKD